MNVSVADAARILGVDDSRVRQLLRSGKLSGHRLGSIWLVDRDALAFAAARPALPVRPLSPIRAWALLDLLDGGSAAWLSPAARSQVRAQLRKLADSDADHWRAALRSRSQVLACQVHPAAVSRLISEDGVLRSGPQLGAESGLDLVAVSAAPEIYVRPDRWPALAEKYQVESVAAADSNLVVRLPRSDQWPERVGRATLAADSVDSAEPRAVSAGVSMLNDLARQAIAGAK